MQIVRTVVWVLLLVALLIFSFFNWKPVDVQIWDNLILETKIPALVIISFLLGLVPMWLIHRGARWRLHRRIGALETAARTNAANAAAAAAAPPPSPEPLVPESEKPQPRDEILG
jgi:hypothetical protein